MFCDLSESGSCYEAVVKAVVRGGEVDRAMKVLEDMVAKRIVPTVGLCNAIMNAVARGPEWSKAFEMMTAMAGMGVTPNEIRSVVVKMVMLSISPSAINVLMVSSGWICLVLVTGLLWKRVFVDDCGSELCHSWKR